MVWSDLCDVHEDYLQVGGPLPKRTRLGRVSLNLIIDWRKLVTRASRGRELLQPRLR